MDMTAEAMQKVLDISRPEIHTLADVHGVETIFSTEALHQVQAAAFAIPGTVKVSTLLGFADLINADLEGRTFPPEFVIHVENEGLVSLKGKKSDEYGRRLVLIEAKPVSFRQFTFGQWMNQEEFAIAVASLFAETPDKEYVLKMASTLTKDAAVTSEDDGFSQRVTAKAGLRMKEQITLKPRVDLAPYRTFPELDQPVSPFVLRAKCDGESNPMLMLVEADGGRWKIDAIAKLRKAMEAFGLNIPIVA